MLNHPKQSIGQRIGKLLRGGLERAFPPKHEPIVGADEFLPLSLLTEIKVGDLQPQAARVVEEARASQIGCSKVACKNLIAAVECVELYEATRGLLFEQLLESGMDEVDKIATALLILELQRTDHVSKQAHGGKERQITFEKSLKGQLAYYRENFRQLPDDPRLRILTFSTAAFPWSMQTSKEFSRHGVLGSLVRGAMEEPQRESRIAHKQYGPIDPYVLFDGPPLVSALDRIAHGSDEGIQLVLGGFIKYLSGKAQSGNWPHRDRDLEVFDRFVVNGGHRVRGSAIELLLKASATRLTVVGATMGTALATIVRRDLSLDDDVVDLFREEYSRVGQEERLGLIAAMNKFAVINSSIRSWVTGFLSDRFEMEDDVLGNINNICEFAKNAPKDSPMRGVQKTISELFVRLEGSRGVERDTIVDAIGQLISAFSGNASFCGAYACMLEHAVSLNDRDAERLIGKLSCLDTDDVQTANAYKRAIVSAGGDSRAIAAICRIGLGVSFFRSKAGALDANEFLDLVSLLAYAERVEPQAKYRAFISDARRAMHGIGSAEIVRRPTT